MSGIDIYPTRRFDLLAWVATAPSDDILDR